MCLLGGYAADIGCAVCIVLLTKALTGASKNAAGKQEGDWMYPAILLLGFVLLYRGIFHLYRVKNPWYRYVLTWCESWSLSRVCGNCTSLTVPCLHLSMRCPRGGL